MVRFFEHQDFFGEIPGNMFYVGFLKSSQVWFPLCVVSDPETATKLDTLLLSSSLQLMDQILKEYAKQLSEIKETFVHFLTREEIKNLLEQYALKNVGLLGEAELSGCGCGCGCG